MLALGTLQITPRPQVTTMVGSGLTQTSPGEEKLLPQLVLQESEAQKKVNMQLTFIFSYYNHIIHEIVQQEKTQAQKQPLSRDKSHANLQGSLRNHNQVF